MLFEVSRPSFRGEAPSVTHRRFAGCSMFVSLFLNIRTFASFVRLEENTKLAGIETEVAYEEFFENKKTCRRAKLKHPFVYVFCQEFAIRCMPDKACVAAQCAIESLNQPLAVSSDSWASGPLLQLLI